MVAYQNLVGRSIDPREPSVITVGAFQAGDANNVIPDMATLKPWFHVVEPREEVGPCGAGEVREAARPFLAVADRLGEAVEQLQRRQAAHRHPGEELRVANDRYGRPYVSGAYGRTLPEHTVSLAHRGEVGVAIARYGPCGIDVEEVKLPAESTLDAAFGASERELFDGLGGTDVWFARFWTAKEAVAKLRGTGLKGEPRDFEVVTASPEELTVRAGGTDYRVHCASVTNLPASMPRDYVVSWTEMEKENRNEHRNDGPRR